MINDQPLPGPDPQLDPLLNEMAVISAKHVEPHEPEAMYIAADGKPFNPHNWVIRAMRMAYQMGRTQSELVADAVEDRYKEREQALIRSVMASCLESMAPNPEMPGVLCTAEVNLEQMVTIWDRVDLYVKFDPETTIATYTLTTKGVPQ